jgi:long-subunit acyl-CoA synthetase (AMP-forming)
MNVESRGICKANPRNGAKTIIECLEKAKDKHGGRKCVGWREVVQVHMVDEGGAKREKIQLKNEYEWMNYHEYWQRVLLLSRGLSQIGLEEKGRLVIYAETQRDWMMSAFAGWFSNCQVVTIYATLGEEGAIHGINETEATMVIADAKLMKVLTKILPKCPSIKQIVTMTPCEPAMADKVKAAGITLSSMDEVADTGKTAQFSPKLPTPEDLAVIMYTSGTTGAPKGVLMTHGNIVAMVAAIEHFGLGALNEKDTILCYLPLAHIMEMAAEICFMSLGCALGFGSPHTLTDTSVKLKRPESVGDAPCLGPTGMVFAPAVLDKVYQGVQNKRSNLSGIGGTLFDWGLINGEKRFGRGGVGANAFFNSLVFKKVQALVGGKLKLCITGSAPLSKDIQMFVQTVLGCPVRQGYGLTETCAGSCICMWSDNTHSVGPPTVCTKIRLADWPEGNYMNSDKDKPEIGMRRGEVLIGGPSVSQGYFINSKTPNEELQQKNAEDWITVGEERFFRSGDIGQITDTGCLQIIDRKKDLWKGPNGEYVALTKVEAALKLCEFVDMPMVYGKTGGEFPIALICPQKPRVQDLAKELGVSGDFEQLCQDKKIVDKITEACREQCKKQKLVEFEIPKKVALISELWTPENDMLTAAMKLKRPIIAAKHKEDIDRLYA